jgi:RNA polymerase sigma factor (sigma-70 family)
MTDLVLKARQGDRAALEALVLEAKDLVYNLAVRVLGDRADAEDASQEIMIRIVTGLATFRGDSAFKTWVYTIASNHLMTAKKRDGKEQTFEMIEEYLDIGIAADLPPLEDQVLVSQAKIVCISKMMLSLDRDHRLAFVLGEILELSSEEGAQVLEIAPDAFRKRLSRARARMNEFMQRRCGIVNAANPCRCAKQATCAVQAGRLSRQTAVWAMHPAKKTPVLDVENLDELQRVSAVFKSLPEYAGPDSLIAGLKALLVTEKSR